MKIPGISALIPRQLRFFAIWLPRCGNCVYDNKTIVIQFVNTPDLSIVRDMFMVFTPDKIRAVYVTLY